MLREILNLEGAKKLQKHQLTQIIAGSSSSLKKLEDGRAGCNADSGCSSGCSELSAGGYYVCSYCCIA